MPVIRVSEETLERLRKWAIPLKDTMDSALRKAIDAAEEYQRHKEGGKDALIAENQMYQNSIK